jgi:chemosensory pili system protein ChpC
MTQSTNPLEVRGVLLPLQGGQLLLPNATVNEVVGFRDPIPVDSNDTDWLLGTFDWRQQKVPIVAFEKLLGLPKDETGHRARIAICNTLNGNARCPYIGILLRSIPHLTRLTEELIAPLGELGDAGPMVARQVRLNGQEAWIPDLDALEQAVLDIIN